MASITKGNKATLVEQVTPSALEDRIKAMENLIAESQAVIAQQSEVIGSLTEQVKNSGVEVKRGKVDSLQYIPELIDRDHTIGDKGSSNVYCTTDIKQAIAYAKDTPNIVIAMIDLDLCYQSYDNKVSPPKPKGYPAKKDMKFFHIATTHGYTDYFPVTLNTGEKADISFSLNAQLRPSKPIQSGIVTL